MRALPRLRLTPALTTLIGTFVFLTASMVLGVQVLTTQKVLQEIGVTLVTTRADALQSRFSDYLKVVEHQARFAAETIQANGLLAGSDEDLTTYLHGTLAATPQTGFVLVQRMDGRTAQVERTHEIENIRLPNRPHTDRKPVRVQMAKRVADQTDGIWSQPEFLKSKNDTFTLYALALREGDQMVGTLMFGVALRELSEITSSLSNDQMTVFVMLGEDRVLAHPDLVEATDLLHHQQPEVQLRKAPASLLSSMRQENASEVDTMIPASMTLTRGLDAEGERRMMMKEKTTFILGDQPLVLGAQFSEGLLRQPFDQIFRSILIGLALLGLALIAAGVMAYSIAKPIRRAAHAANLVGRLELTEVPRLPDSPVRELHDLSSGFNSMVVALNAFLRYMPHSLVTKVIREGVDAAPPEERRLAVLFTDIVGFTPLSEGMSVDETTDFINHHLSLIDAAIEEHDGTLDKYIGDSVMAFWGAPEHLDHPEVPSAMAALDIACRIHEDNTARKARGLQPVRIRIGLHVGPLVVGDIGAETRVNYTVIGDTVNIASRLETLGKTVDPDAEVVILVSRDVAERLPEDIPQEALGEQSVPGRHGKVDVVRLFPRP